MAAYFEVETISEKRIISAKPRWIQRLLSSPLANMVLCRVERAAGNLLKDAASLLLYQSAVTGPPAQALLKLLLALRRSDGEELNQ
jgi:hypothetical protein